MKTYIYLLFSALLLCAAFSCKKDPQGGDQENPSSQPGYPPATQVYSIKLSKTYAIVYSADYQLTAIIGPPRPSAATVTACITSVSRVKMAK